MQEADTNLRELYASLNDFKSDFRNKNLMSLLVKQVLGISVLDVGCGTGYLLSLLKAQGKEIYGIEPNQDLIDIGKKFFGALPIIPIPVSDLEKAKIKPVETIVTIDVLEHIEHDEATLEKFNRLLKDFGQLIVVVPALPWIYGVRDKNIGHVRRYSKRELIEKIARAGFTIEKVRFWNMLGVAPYFIAEKILKREINSSIRQGSGGPIKRIMNTALDYWFRYIENNIDFGIGLSLICYAKKA